MRKNKWKHGIKYERAFCASCKDYTVHYGEIGVEHCIRHEKLSRRVIKGIVTVLLPELMKDMPVLN